MAVIITHTAEDIGAQSQQSITTIERLMQVEGESLAEIVRASVIPQPRSSHPQDARFRLVDRSFDIVGNLERKIQVAIRLVYNNDSNLKWPSSGANENANNSPWQLGAQNVSVSYSTEPAPLKYGYNLNGEWFRLCNSAGSQLLIEGQRIIRQISFTYFVKASRTGRPPVNNRPEINITNEIIAGFLFAPFTAMLMPMNAQFLVDVDDKGKETRHYWQIEAVILENERSWMREALDVGTMAVFKDGAAPQPIYQYTPWPKREASANIGEKPKFGSIDDVLKAKDDFANMDTNEYDRRFDMLPYSEVTEPVPLLNGKVFEDALNDPANKPYNTVKYFEVAPTSWVKYNIPRDRG